MEMIITNTSLFKNNHICRVSTRKKEAIQSYSSESFQPLPVFNYPLINFNGKKEQKIQKDLNKIITKNHIDGSSLILGVKNGFIDKLSKKLADKNQKSIIIGIAGDPASGKSTLANAIQQSISDLPSLKKGLITVINCDNYYEDLVEQLKIHKNYGKLLENGYDPHNPKTQNLKLMRQHIGSLKQGHEVLIPEYLFDTCESIPEKIKKSPAKIILYEGIFALDPKLADICDIKIYVKTPAKLTEQRYLERAILRGKDESTAKKLFSDLENSTQKYISSAQDNADLVLSGNTPKETVSEIVNDIFLMFQK
jgi:uridine kinase